MTKKFNSIERCDYNVIHEDIVNQVRDKMPQEESLYDLAELFKGYVWNRIPRKDCTNVLVDVFEIF